MTPEERAAVRNLIEAQPGSSRWNVDAMLRAAEDATKPDLWHRPVPGPSYWDWRCLTCSEPVAAHPGLLARIRHRRELRKA